MAHFNQRAASLLAADETSLQECESRSDDVQSFQDEQEAVSKSQRKEVETGCVQIYEKTIVKFTYNHIPYI